MLESPSKVSWQVLVSGGIRATTGLKPPVVVVKEQTNVTSGTDVQEKLIFSTEMYSRTYLQAHALSDPRDETR